MSNIHLIIQRILMLGFALCFAFVSVYVPQPINKIPRAEAGVDALESTQWLNRGLLALVNVATTATSFFMNNLFVKEYILDPLAWFTRKMLLAHITNSLIRWINSGFQGEPSFVQDIERYMLRIGDMLFENFVHKVGVAPFICKPFRLNVQVAFAQSYRYSRAFLPRGSSYCSMQGALANIDNFVSGSFNDGGWDAWYRVSVQPNTYTPYGNLLQTQNEASRQILNAQNNESSLIGYGRGHRSNKLCNYVPSIGGTQSLRCVISTPGHVISEALDFQLSVGQRSMIVADEISESIGAIMGALANQALMGTAGLLGLSGGTGHTDYSYGGNNSNSAADQIIIDQEDTQGSTTERIAKIVFEQRERESEYITKAEAYKVQMRRMPSGTEYEHEANYIETTLIPEIQKTIQDINDLVNEVEQDPSKLQSAFARYKKLHLHTQEQIAAQEDEWFDMFNKLFTDSLVALTNYREKAVFYEKALRDDGQIEEADAVLVEIGVIDQQLKALKEIGDTYSQEKSTNPAAGAEAVEAYLDLKPSLYTKSYAQSNIDYWESLL